jgi:hypothetical protein
LIVILNKRSLRREGSQGAGDKNYALLAEWTGYPAYNRETRRLFMAPQRATTNSNSPGPLNPPTLLESSFERVVDFLKLSPEQYQSSTELREWVLQNKDHKYVPPDLLKAFGFHVNLEP